MIYKYELKCDIITIPHDSRFLHAIDKYFYIELGKESHQQYMIYFVGTGWPEDTSNDHYITSTKDGDYVWHWFAKDLNFSS